MTTRKPFLSVARVISDAVAGRSTVTAQLSRKPHTSMDRKYVFRLSSVLMATKILVR
jgi:cob(I)alamin adenosyltransferase